MNQPENRIALELARKQKRLKSWRSSFQNAGIPEQLRTETQNLLNTYSLLIAKFASCVQTSDIEDCGQRINEIESSLTAAFDAHRLAKSEFSPMKK